MKTIMWLILIAIVFNILSKTMTVAVAETPVEPMTMETLTKNEKVELLALVNELNGLKSELASAESSRDICYSHRGDNENEVVVMELK